MLLKNKKIAIIGGGPGGLTLAKLLQMKGAVVHVYERDLNKNARVQGSPLDLHEESGLAALKNAGLLEEFKNSFMSGADRTTITDHHAKILFSDHGIKKEENFGDKHFRPEIDRGVLRKILLESLEPLTVVWNSHFISMERKCEGWLLHFKESKSVYADFVIGADGANSKIRPYLTDIKPFYSGITMLEGNVYEGKTAVPKIDEILRGGKIMAFGNERNILMGQKAYGEIGFYASFRAEENWARKSGIDFSDRTAVLTWFKNHYVDWDHIWHELFENAAIPFIPRPIYCMPLDQSWQPHSNLTIIGDAAHLMPPFAGEGVNMAMLDALELSRVLTTDRFNTIQDALADFETNMCVSASQMARESLENGDKMHSENALATMLDFFGGFEDQ